MKCFKEIIKTAIVFFNVIIATTSIANAQDSGRAEKMKSTIDSRNYIFKADAVWPISGSRRQLNPDEYDIKIFNDTLIVLLPYFGKVHTPSMDPNNIGIRFTSTEFSYNVKSKRKNRWQVIITPKDTKDVSELSIDISNNGSTTVTVTSNNRQPISFSGYVVGRNKSNL